MRGLESGGSGNSLHPLRSFTHMNYTHYSFRLFSSTGLLSFCARSLTQFTSIVAHTRARPQKIVRFWAVLLTTILFIVHQHLVFILATQAGTLVLDSRANKEGRAS